jgi:hypothetical protein
MTEIKLKIKASLEKYVPTKSTAMAECWLRSGTKH